MELRDLQEKAHVLAKLKGWWDDFPDTGPERWTHINSRLMTIITELAEASEEVASGSLKQYYEVPEGRDEVAKPCGFGIELADTIIRIVDLAEGLRIDIQSLVEEKMAYNKTRPYRHGGKTV